MALSVTQLKTLFKCPIYWLNKYFYKFKPDYEFDTKALIFGKAYHAMLEGVSEEEALKDINDIQTKLLIKGMYKKTSQDLKEVKIIEREKFFSVNFEGYNFIGFIDAIIEKDNKKMIAEFKTCTTFTPDYRLKYDLQILFYGNYSSEYEEVFYHQTKKPNIKLKQKETEEEYLKRVEDSCETMTTILNNTQLKEECYEQLIWGLSLLKAVLSAKEKPKPIFLNHTCIQFNKPCPYFELCFGKRRDEFDIATRKENIQNLSIIKEIDNKEINIINDDIDNDFI